MVCKVCEGCGFVRAGKYAVRICPERCVASERRTKIMMKNLKDFEREIFTGRSLVAE